MTQTQISPVQESPVSDSSAAHAKAVELGQHVVRMTTAAGSGHPSTALALGHIIVELMYRRMRYDPANPWNPANDRLVLSAGHAVPMVYAAYADLGGVVGSDPKDARPLSVEDLSSLREQDSVLDGHPNPAEGFPFFDAATGSLGQGLSVAAGLALAARLDKLDRHIYVVAGDGEAREGQIWEAADFIADHELTNVTLVLSCNGHGQAGPVSPQQSPETLAAKLTAFGWHVVDVDGHNPAELTGAFDQVGQGGKPGAIIARTIKGWGVDSIVNLNYHGKPIPPKDLDKVCAELDATGAKLGAKPGKMALPSPNPAVPRSTGKPKTITLPPIEQAFKRAGFDDALRNKKLATRTAYGAALVALGDRDERIVALDGDVSNSTFANLFAKEHPARFFECKIAEQNMISAAAGLAATGRIPFASSFGKFLARAVDQIDLASITRANIKIVGSHSGVSLAADGPSQMSLSDMAYFRSMTRVDSGRGGRLCHVFHPSDAICAYRCVELMANTEGLCYLRTHRPTERFLYPLDERFEVGGCKQLRAGRHLTLVGSGYMVFSVLSVAEKLAAEDIECDVFDVYSLPLDAAPILESARGNNAAILTVEDNYIGGVHAELAEAAAESGDVRVVGVTASRMPKSARTAEEVFSHVGVSEAYILERARELTTG